MLNEEDIKSIIKFADAMYEEPADKFSYTVGVVIGYDIFENATPEKKEELLTRLSIRLTDDL